MNVLFSINHPAHVYFFKNTIKICEKLGHNVIITARDKEMTTYLLNKFEFKFQTLTIKKSFFIFTILELAIYQFKLYRILKKNKINLVMSVGGTFVAHISKFIGIPSLCFYDTENATMQNLFTYPFSSKIITPKCYEKKIFNNHIIYDSYHELAYLHPKYFCPNREILKHINLKNISKYIIIRFVGWDASHDRGHDGISLKNKILAVKKFSKYAKVLISSEKKLPNELEKYKINIPPEKIHDAIAFSSLVYGESATMSSEAAVLGVPSIYLDNEGRGYTNEQEDKYGIVFNYSESKKDQELSILKGIEILKNTNSTKVFSKIGKKIVGDKINLTDWIIDYLENENYLERNN